MITLECVDNRAIKINTIHTRVSDLILHHVDGNSSWLEAMQNQLGGELILARTCALAQM